MPWLLNNSPVSDNGFKTGDPVMTYPAGWIKNASVSERLAIGVTEAPSPKAYDERFSFGWNAEGTEQSWKDIALLKSEYKSQQDSVAASILSDSDWRVIKAKEIGGTIPTAWKTYRAAVRTAANTRQTEIDAASDTQALQTIIQNHSLTDWPDAPTS